MKNKMKWLKKIITQWVREDWENARQEKEVPQLCISRDVEAKMCDSDPILHFRVFSAVGGKVVEFRRYDRKTDRNDTTSYIITNDQDFGDRIAKIATMESLKS
jgi:hypothetical protein